MVKRKTTTKDLKMIMVLLSGKLLVTSGTRALRALNKEYKEGRGPIRFNRRLIQLDPKEQAKNKAYQLIRLMEYLNELPVIQITIDFVEADDVIAYGARHPYYGAWDKIIVSSDKDFFQLCDKHTSIYRPIQNKIVTEQTILEDFKIHPNNFALARAIAGDPIDNLPGVAGVGLKTIAKRFQFLVHEEESDRGAQPGGQARNGRAAHREYAASG